MDKAHIDSLLTQAGKFFNFSRGRDIATLRESIHQMFDESELLRHIDDKNTKLQFIGSVLNASSVDNEAFGKFVSLVENDYAAFANSVSLREEVEAYTKLLALQKELARLLSLKAIANKSTIAVGGGFSAGKSQFVSSFFGDNTIALPIGVTPVTAIASYIVNGDRHIIKGYTYQNGVVDVPLDLYANLSHDFIKELGFNLKNILPHRKLSLHNFLHSVDKDIASKEQLKNELNGVFAMYENALEADKQRAKNIRSVISSLELDILESGMDFDEGKKADIKAKSKNSKKSKKARKQMSQS